MYGIRALVVTVLLTAAVPCASAHGSGGHRGGSAGFGHGVRTVPGLTPQGRFVHGPSFGHPSFAGRPHVRNRVVFAAPLIVPGYYGMPMYATPFPYAVPPVTYEPPPVSYAPPAVTYTPPPVTYAPAPPVASALPPAAAAPERVAAAPTPIFFCAELHAYTDDLKSMSCPGHWRRMTN